MNDNWLGFFGFLAHTQDHHRDEMVRLFILIGLTLHLLIAAAVIAADLL
ncbi:hypothetical protein ACFVUY_38020 [Kitasatospora sp. NPDC058063]